MNIATDAGQEFLERQTRLLCASYVHWTGHNLITAATERDAVQRLLAAPFAVVAHDTQAEPIFNYANACALRLFGMSWQEFTQLPSRLSAEPLAQDEREKLLQRVKQHGFIDDYAGMRIAKDGMRFMIRNATVWNLLDVDGNYCGQAAKFDCAGLAEPDSQETT